jgi:hypothetical protein
MALTLTSPAFPSEAPVPRQYTCDGEDRSPELRWTGAPAETGSLALIVHDPDAPRGDFTHWVLFDIPPTPAVSRRVLPPTPWASRAPMTSGRKGTVVPARRPAMDGTATSSLSTRWTEGAWVWIAGHGAPTLRPPFGGTSWPRHSS